MAARCETQSPPTPEDPLNTISQALCLYVQQWANSPAIEHQHLYVNGNLDVFFLVPVPTGNKGRKQVAFMLHEITGCHIDWPAPHQIPAESNIIEIPDPPDNRINPYGPPSNQRQFTPD